MGGWSGGWLAGVGKARAADKSEGGERCGLETAGADHPGAFPVQPEAFLHRTSQYPDWHRGPRAPEPAGAAAEPRMHRGDGTVSEGRTCGTGVLGRLQKDFFLQ